MRYVKQDNGFSWNNPQGWPYDAPDHVFCARAALSIGAAMFDDWTDKDPHAAAIRFTHGGADPKRFNKVQEKIREECQFGRLQAWLQHSDGTFSSIPTHLWNTRDHLKWTMGAKAPQTILGGHWHPMAHIPDCWVYFSRRDLSGLLAKLNGSGRHSKKKAAPQKFSAAKAREVMQEIIDDVEAGRIPQPIKERRNADDQRESVVDIIVRKTGANPTAARKIYTDMRPPAWGKTGKRSAD
jgi:hypothetical protein